MSKNNKLDEIVYQKEGKNGNFYNIEVYKKIVEPNHRAEMKKLTKEKILDKYFEIYCKLIETENKCTNLKHRKSPKFTKSEVERIKKEHENLSIRKLAAKENCSKGTIEKIVKGTYKAKN